MQFQGAKSYIHCLAYTLNQIIQDILQELKSGLMQETEKGEDNAKVAGPIAKLRHIVVWIGRSSQ